MSEPVVSLISVDAPWEDWMKAVNRVRMLRYCEPVIEMAPATERLLRKRLARQIEEDEKQRGMFSGAPRPAPTARPAYVLGIEVSVRAEGPAEGLVRIAPVSPWAKPFSLESENYT